MTEDETADAPCSNCQGWTSANCPVFRSPDSECPTCGGCYCDGAC
jgi:hypothetical protein